MMAFSKFLLATFVMAASTTLAASNTSNGQVAMYWGLPPKERHGLSYYCHPRHRVDMIIVGGYIRQEQQQDYTWHIEGCYLANATRTKACDVVSRDIEFCQRQGTKILANLQDNRNISTRADAIKFAQRIWKFFGPMQQDKLHSKYDNRVFGNVSFDGLNFDILTVANQSAEDWTAATINSIRAYAMNDTSKRFYFAGTPQCRVPRANDTSAIRLAKLDYVFIQETPLNCSVYGSSIFTKRQMNTHGRGPYNLGRRDEPDARGREGYNLRSRDELDARGPGGYDVESRDGFDARGRAVHNLGSRYKLDARDRRGYKLRPRDALDTHGRGRYNLRERDELDARGRRGYKVESRNDHYARGGGAYNLEDSKLDARGRRGYNFGESAGNARGRRGYNIGILNLLARAAGPLARGRSGYNLGEHDAEIDARGGGAQTVESHDKLNTHGLGGYNNDVVNPAHGGRGDYIEGLGLGARGRHGRNNGSRSITHHRKWNHTMSALADWSAWLRNTTSQNATLFIGVSSYGGTNYDKPLSPHDLKQMIKNSKKVANFGGVVIWDTHAADHVDSRIDFMQDVVSVIDNGDLCKTRGCVESPSKNRTAHHPE